MYPALILLLEGSVISIDGSFLFIFISILLLIFLLNRTLFVPLNQVLDERESLGAGRLNEAKQLLRQFDEKLDHYEQQIRQARAAAYQELESQRKEALTARQQLLDQVKQETAAQFNAAKDDITQQVAGARQTLENEAHTMAATISSQILKRPVG
ncbi:MAG: ATP synthase F0 subunit B [Acidobacteria bacterium]|nr:ATP synthase F0 subunit B [Acidobacteriota bacterium]MBI3426699.1 ATP synthase F0 subunit B [Acidobacteriota bacterium]